MDLSLYCMSCCIVVVLYCIVFVFGSLFVLYELEDTRNHYQLPSSPKSLYPFNSFHNAALGGFLYSPQKGSYLQQTLNLNRFLNPITEHPIQVPNGVDF